MENANAVPPLLAEAEGNEVPNLGWDVALEPFEEDNQSPLERLIAQSTAEQREGSFVNRSGFWDDSNFIHSRQMMPSPRLSPPTTPSEITTTKPPMVFIVTCMCSLSQVGLVWYSFLSSSWLDTRLFISIVLPSMTLEVDQSQLLQSETLGSILGDLLGNDQHWSAVGMILTSLGLPCLCFVSGAAWLIEDRKERNKTMRQLATTGRVRNLYRQSLCNYLSPRQIVEYVARISFSILFVLCILDVGTSPVTIEFNESRFTLVNQIQGGMAAYAMGMFCGLSVFALLRLSRSRVERTFDPMDPSHYHRISRGDVGINLETECFWEVHSNELFAGFRRTGNPSSDERELVTPFLQNEWYQNGTASDREELRVAIEETTRTIEDHPVERDLVETGVLSFWKRAVLFTLSFLSTILWVPALCMPLFKLKYDGIASEFMSNVSATIRLVDFPIELWERGASAGTNRWVLFIIESIFVLLVFLGPFLANILVIGTWICDDNFGRFCMNGLWIIQPFLGTIIFALALYISVPAFETVTESAVIKFASLICDKFEETICFAIQGESSLGLWILLGQSFALEILVVLTMAWETHRT